MLSDGMACQQNSIGDLKLEDRGKSHRKQTESFSSWGNSSTIMSFVRNCESETLQVSTVAVGHVIKWGCRTAVTGAVSTPGSYQCSAVRHGATLPVVEFISALGLPCFYAHAVQPPLPPPTATQQMATSGLKGLMQHRLLAVRLKVYFQHYYHSAILPSNSKVPRGASIQPLRGQWLFS